MQKRLALAFPAGDIAATAVALDLRNVSAYRPPSANLTIIFLRQSPAHVVPAVPLKPPARIGRMNPSFLAPDGERLAGIDAEVVECGIMPFMTQFRVREPITRKFFPAIRHVFSAENAEPQHVLRCEIGRESRIEIFPFRLRECVRATLHQVMDANDFFRTTHA